MLLDETVGKLLPVENLVAALGGDVDEPVQNPQSPNFVVVATGADPPHRDVVIEHLRQERLIASNDRRKQFIGQID